MGGAERVLLAAIRGAREHLPGARLDVVLFADGPLRAEAERLGAAVTVVPLPASLAGLGDTRLRDNGRPRTLARLGFGWAALGEAPAAVGFVRRLRAALRRSAPDLIHSNGLKAHALTAVARPRGVPVLWHLHDFLSHRPVMVHLLRRLTLGVAGGIAISDAVRRDVEAVLPGLAISVVRNAVDTDHFAPADRDGAELDRLAELEPARPGVVRVGLVATYANWKGQDVFLDALARLPATGRRSGVTSSSGRSMPPRGLSSPATSWSGGRRRTGWPAGSGSSRSRRTRRTCTGCSTWRCTPASGRSRSG